MKSHEILKSFTYLNNRFDSLIKSSCNLHLSTASHCDPVFSFYNSFQAASIYFADLKSSRLFQFNLLKFIGLRSFHIFRLTDSRRYIEPIEQLEQFIHPRLSPRLESFQVPYCSQSIVDWIFNGQFPYLKICHLYDSSNWKINLPLSTNILLVYLRQLTIKDRTGNEFEKILLQCPNLRYFDFSCDDLWSPFKQLTNPYVSLKRLRLSYFKQFLFHDGQFNSLLFYFPNLTHFYLNVEQCHQHDETIDFVEIARNLKQYLSHLTFLEWHIDLTVRNRSSFYRHTFKQLSQLHPLFSCCGRSYQHLHIASFDFTSMYRCDRQFSRI